MLNGIHCIFDCLKKLIEDVLQNIFRIFPVRNPFLNKCFEQCLIFCNQLPDILWTGWVIHCLSGYFRLLQRGRSQVCTGNRLCQNVPFAC